MGFPLGYTYLNFPKLLLHFLSILFFIRKLICNLFTIFGLPEFLEPEFNDPTRPGEENTRLCSVSAAIIREILPVVKFSDIVDPPENCVVCLYDFDSGDEIRMLLNCRHVFHRSCVDRWMDHDQKTCPLCRKEFVPEGMMGIFNEKLWLAFGIPAEYSQTSL